jgi:hypothetical protein
MPILKRLFCKHDWEIVNESHKSVYLGPVDGWIRVKQVYLLYCKKCKKKKWFTEEETKTIMKIKEIENSMHDNTKR